MLQSSYWLYVSEAGTEDYQPEGRREREKEGGKGEREKHTGSKIAQEMWCAYHSGQFCLRSCVLSLSEEEYEVAECLGMGTKELARSDRLQVAIERLSSHL